MKKIVLSFIKSISFFMMMSSFVFLMMTFFSITYFTDMGSDYLKGELKGRLEVLDEKFDKGIQKVDGVVDKVSESKIGKKFKELGLGKKVGELKDKLDEKTEVLKEKVEILKGKASNKIDEVVEKSFKGEAEDIKDIIIFGKSLKDQVLSTINNFILDIRIFLFTNLIGFGLIYLLMFFKSRLDVIRNMFYITVIIFIIMMGGTIFYIAGQNWITNIVTNSFLGLIYPFVIFTFIGISVYYISQPINEADKKMIAEAKYIKPIVIINKNLGFVKTLYKIIAFIIGILFEILLFPLDL